MGMIGRFTDIMKSNINAALDKAENPAKMIDQTLRNAREDLAKVRKETANVMADAKNAEMEYNECKQQSEQYASAARNALKAGNENDARALLEQKQVYDNNLVALGQAKELSASNAQKMKEMHDKLTRDIQGLEAKRSAIKAKVATAKAQEHINDVVSGGDKAKSSMEKFERMEDKADKMLNAAMAEADLNEGKTDANDLLNKYSGGNDDTGVEDEIEKMKKELGL